MNPKNKSFTFGILAYNHEMYIIEHLESIKFLIQEYGEDYECRLIISDDGSRDHTLLLTKEWIEVNRKIFSSVQIIFDGTNLGTCKRYIQILDRIDSHLFKITAGDDTYSFLNIFEVSQRLTEFEMRCFVPLNIIDRNLLPSILLRMLTYVSSIFATNKRFCSVFLSTNMINTPNVMYSKELVTNKSLNEFIKSFKVVEDFAQWVGFVKFNVNVRLKWDERTLVYYRRTVGSTFIVRHSAFVSDRLNILNECKKLPLSRLENFLLNNRILIESIRLPAFKRLLLFSNYLFLLAAIKNVRKVAVTYLSGRREFERHQSHYKTIKERAEAFYSNRGAI